MQIRLSRKGSRASKKRFVTVLALHSQCTSTIRSTSAASQSVGVLLSSAPLRGRRCDTCQVAAIDRDNGIGTEADCGVWSTRTNDYPGYSGSRTITPIPLMPKHDLSLALKDYCQSIWTTWICLGSIPVGYFCVSSERSFQQRQPVLKTDNWRISTESQAPCCRRSNGTIAADLI